MNEIAQDASTVGNALKTISMRIRAMDEETGEFDDTLQTISGDIYELTHGQVSIMQDANTYKDIYTILDDISKVWDSLTDKEHATLTETLFGKHRANIGSAIISNFEQARKAIETMENADGGAMAEMEVIMDSISYKTNTFKETLVGIAQNSFSQDFMKSMVDSGTRILNVFDDLSPSISFILEQFATLLEFVTKLADTIGGIPLLIAGIGLKNVGNIKTWLYELKEVQMAINGISTLSTWANGGTNQFVDTAVVTQYANQLRGLSAQQVELALSTKMLTAEQKQQIMVELGLVASENKIQAELLQTTLAQSGLSAEKQKAILLELELINATTLEPIARKSCTKAQLEEQLALHGVTGAQAEQIMSTLGMSTANATATVSFKLLATSILSSAKAMGLWLATTPAGWATIAVTAISAVVLGINAYNKKQEELREEAIESAKATQELTDSMDDLISQYEGIVDSEKSESEKTKELTEWKQTLAETYGITKDKLANLNLEREEGIELLKEEIRLAKIRQQDDWRDKNEDVVAKSRQRLDRASKFNSNGYSYMDGTDVWTQQSSSVSNDIKALFDRIERTNGGLDIQLKIDTDNAIEELERLQSISNEITNISFTRTLTSSEQQLLDDIKSQIAYLETFQSDIDVVKQDISANAFIKFETYKTNDESYKNLGKESYISWRDGLLKTANGDKLLEKELLSLAEQQFPDYAKYFENLNKAKIQFGAITPNSGFDALKKNFLESLSDEDLEIAIQIPDLFIDGIENATEKIENFKKVNNFDKSIKSLEELKEAYDGISDSADKFISNQKTLNSAFEEQEKYGQLASSTVSSLIEAGYSRALSVDAETGAITLNKDAVEMLNNVKKQELKLSIMREKLSLQEKLRDESVEINSLTAEMAHATEERREEIRTLIAERMAQASLNDEAVELIEQYDAILAMIDNPIEFDSDNNKSTKDEEPAKVTAFKKELAEKQHLVAMKKLSEEEYLNWLDGAYKEAYAGLEGYDDDLYKYEEEIFSKRRELAEKAFDDTIDGIEKEIDALDKLKDNASLDINAEGSIYSVIDQQILLYQQAIAEIDKRIAELESSGLVGIEDEIEELNKQKDDLLEKVYNLGKERTSTGIENEISYWEEMQSKQNDFYDKQIEKLKKQKELLEDKNDEEERAKDLAEKQLELRKAQIALEDARRNRNVLVYTAGGGYSYEADQTAIAEAEEDVKKAKEDLEELRQEEIKDNLDKQIEILEEQKDKDSEYYDTIIKLLEDMSGKNKVQSESNRSIWGQLLATDAGQKALAQIDPDKLQELLDSGFLVQKDGKYSLGEKKPNDEKVNEVFKAGTDVISMLSKLLHKSESEIKSNDKLMNAVTNGGFNSLAMPSQSALSELTKTKGTMVTNYNNSKISNTYHVDKIDIGYSGDDFNDMLGQAFNAMNQQITINGNKVAYGN